MVLFFTGCFAFPLLPVFLDLSPVFVLACVLSFVLSPRELFFVLESSEPILDRKDLPFSFLFFSTRAVRFPVEEPLVSVFVFLSIDRFFTWERVPDYSRPLLFPFFETVIGLFLV